ncbi:MAG: hypothetical protein LH628_15175 [Microcoleus sp. CAN_BIN18]|nr:hypothetical protein [Microcoleus sp. CAN_BIN18]
MTINSSCIRDIRLGNKLQTPPRSLLTLWPSTPRAISSQLEAKASSRSKINSLSPCGNSWQAGTNAACNASSPLLPSLGVRSRTVM